MYLKHISRNAGKHYIGIYTKMKNLAMNQDFRIPLTKFFPFSWLFWHPVQT